MFSSEICEFFKIALFTNHLWWLLLFTAAFSLDETHLEGLFN